MLASCLCITEERPAFIEWLLWNYDRQSWPEKELIIVDSSVVPFSPGREDVRVIVQPPGSGVADKRNLALQAARGEVITWFDDDDWQHPDKLEILVEQLRDGQMVYAGSRRGWFVDVRDLLCHRFKGESPIALLPTMASWREAVTTVVFTEDWLAVDTAWMWDLYRAFGHQAAMLEREDLSFWLCHNDNLYNRYSRWDFYRDLDELREMIGPEAWGGTDAQLVALQRRLGVGGGA